MDVLMPQLGETVAEGKITKWFKSAGEQVKPGDNLFEIETDKVSMEVPSTTTGVLAEIRVPAGDVAPVGAIETVQSGVGVPACEPPEAVGASGIAQAAGEREPDLAALAAPVLGRGGVLAAILGLQGPAGRVELQALQAPLRSAAFELGRSLGGPAQLQG